MDHHDMSLSSAVVVVRVWDRRIAVGTTTPAQSKRSSMAMEHLFKFGARSLLQHLWEVFHPASLAVC